MRTLDDRLNDLLARLDDHAQAIAATVTHTRNVLATAPPLHLPTFRRPDLAPGTADCRKCGRVITADSFLDEPCPGPA